MLPVSSGVVDVLITGTDVLLAIDEDVMGVLITEATASLAVEEMKEDAPAESDEL